MARPWILLRLDKPRVEILIMEKGKVVGKPKKFAINCCVIDEPKEPRKVQNYGSSLFVSHPKEWIEQIQNNGGEVRTLLLMNENTQEKFILIGKIGEWST